MKTSTPCTNSKRDGNVSDGNAVSKRGRRLALLLHTLLGLASLSVAQAGFDLGSGGFDLGNSTNYQILYSGLGNKLDFQDSRVIGNIGIGGPAGQVNAYVQLNPNSYLKNAGNIDFSGKASVQGGPPVNIGAITGGVSDVQADLDYLSKLSAALGAESGSDIVVKINNGETQTINVSDGKDDGNGNRIFTIQKAGDFVFNNGSSRPTRWFSTSSRGGSISSTATSCSTKNWSPTRSCGTSTRTPRPRSPRMSAFRTAVSRPTGMKIRSRARRESS
jgi:hypothetical protein